MYYETIPNTIACEPHERYKLYRLVKNHIPPQNCDGSGWHRHYDTDYPCGGCFACRKDDKLALLAWAIGCALYLAAHGEVARDWNQALAAARALGSIGRAFHAAGQVGLGVSQGLRAMWLSYYHVEKGTWVRVVGKRGRNVPVGVEGVVTWMGTNELGTARVGLLTAEGGALVYTAQSNVLRVKPDPNLFEQVQARIGERDANFRAAKAARDAKPAVDVRRGDRVKVTDGRDRGAEGEVFWTGASRGSNAPRCGLRTAEGLTVWADCRDVELITKASPKPSKSKRRSTSVKPWMQ